MLCQLSINISPTATQFFRRQRCVTVNLQRVINVFDTDIQRFATTSILNRYVVPAVRAVYAMVLLCQGYCSSVLVTGKNALILHDMHQVVMDLPSLHTVSSGL